MLALPASGPETNLQHSYRNKNSGHNASACTPKARQGRPEDFRGLLASHPSLSEC